jgi:hypothetical protein
VIHAPDGLLERCVMALLDLAQESHSQGKRLICQKLSD